VAAGISASTLGTNFSDAGKIQTVMVSTEAEIRRYFPSPRPLSQRARGDRKYEKIVASVLIEDMMKGRGMFSRLGESWFDDYWMNY